VDWRQGAACQGHDPELWFSALPADRDLATAVCASCCVRSRCLSTALGFEAVGGGSYGLWGGSSERDRKRALAPGRATTRRGPSRRGHTR
jgi:WhiB family transcriptional regulator, redox-sensing transcriptional regulator